MTESEDENNILRKQVVFQWLLNVNSLINSQEILQQSSEVSQET